MSGNDLCYTFFTDGTRQPVFEDAIGQYVIDDEGEPIRGLWYIPPEADFPVIVQVKE